MCQIEYELLQISDYRDGWLKRPALAGLFVFRDVLVLCRLSPFMQGSLLRSLRVAYMDVGMPKIIVTIAARSQPTGGV